MRPVHALRALSAALVLVTGCGSPPAPEAPPTPTAQPKFFRSVAASAGMTFEHKQSRGGRIAFLPETLGPGVASLDYDGDGNQDLFWVQGTGPTNGKDPATVPPSQLYRNTTRAESFDEVGIVSNAGIKGWGQGVTAADLNNDGYPDIVVTGYHDPVKVLMNNGDGTFHVMEGTHGLPKGERWWTSATAVDMDRDGLLDLYLGAYVKFDDKDWLDNPPMIEFSGMQMPTTLAPSPYAPESNAFLANLGTHFEDRTEKLGLGDPLGRAMAAMAADLDGDGWTDLFVANDVSPCALFKGGPGGPKSVAAEAYVAQSRGSMGIALGDTDNDGLSDIVVTHWVGDVPAVYRCVAARGGRLAYQDTAAQTGFAPLPRDVVGWGVGLSDVDRDGRDDLMIVNGHTNPSGTQPLLTPQIGFLMLSQPQGGFKFWLPGGTDAEEPFMQARVGRSAAFTDLDSDGCVDVAVGNNNAVGEVWRHVPSASSWIGLELHGTSSSRHPIGARVKVTAGGVSRTKQLVNGDSFFASNDPRLLVSTGSQAGPYDVEVTWPGGAVETMTAMASNRYHRIVEGGRNPSATH